jgi:predicted metal-binding protein
MRPGQQARFFAEMVKRGADTIVFASCIKRGKTIMMTCPHAEAMIEAVKKKVGDSVIIVEYTR